MTPAAEILRWLSPFPLVYMLSRVLTSQMLYPLGLARETSQIIYATSPLYLVGLFALGKTSGALGGACALFLTEAVQVLLFLILAWRKERTYLLDACRGLNLLARG
jgi:O-antigen/teichoic acid export membrane protein